MNKAQSPSKSENPQQREVDSAVLLKANVESVTNFFAQYQSLIFLGGLGALLVLVIVTIVVCLRSDKCVKRRVLTNEKEIGSL